MKSQNKNFLYNVIYQIFIFIIPLIVTPYISRVLGANNIGIYSYTYSIVYYFMLLTLLGINNYGSKIIAKVSYDKEKISEEFCSIYYLQLISGIVMFAIYNILVFFFFKTDNKLIFIIQNAFLISAIIDINWLFFGLEKFRITISRNIIIKILSIALIFMLVKTVNDLWIYTLIMSVSTLISQLYLWIFASKIIKFKRISFAKIYSNFKGCLILFIPVIAYSIYRVMDKTMLGGISGTVQLGYYENAEKIINIPISIISALGTVTIPYVSRIKEYENSKINSIIKDSFKLCFIFILPMVLGLLVIAKDFSLLFFGEEFIESGNIIILLLPTIIFSGIANVIRTNYLIPYNKDKIYVVSTILGAIFNLVLNLLLIPRYGYYGACIGTIVAEFVVMLYQTINVRNVINYQDIFKIFIKPLLKSILVAIIIFAMGLYIQNLIYKIITQISVAIILYVIMNYNYIINDFFKKNNNIQ